MSAQDPESSGPAPSDGSGDQGARSVLKSIGTGLGCLLFLVGAAVLVFVALAYFFNEPAIAIAAVALVVAFAAYKSRRPTS